MMNIWRIAPQLTPSYNAQSTYARLHNLPNCNYLKSLIWSRNFVQMWPLINDKLNWVGVMIIDSGEIYKSIFFSIIAENICCDRKEDCKFLDDTCYNQHLHYCIGSILEDCPDINRCCCMEKGPRPPLQQSVSNVYQLLFLGLYVFSSYYSLFEFRWYIDVWWLWIWMLMVTPSEW